MNANKDAAAARIRALLSKTTANGCTEAEALAAAAKAGELMDRYALTMSDVEMKQERCEQRGAGAAKSHAVECCSVMIARFCGVKVWHSTRYVHGTATKEIKYFGLPQDVEVALYLTSVIRGAMDRSFKDYLKSPDRPQVHGRTLRASFLAGMSSRINARLREMVEAREATAKTSSGTALVVVRNAIVAEQFAELGLRLTKGRKTAATVRSSGAWHAGQAAGDRVGLNAGLAGGTGALRLS